MGKEAGTGNRLRDNLRDYRGNLDNRAIIFQAITAFTGILETDMTDNLELGWNNF